MILEAYKQLYTLAKEKKSIKVNEKLKKDFEKYGAVWTEERIAQEIKRLVDLEMLRYSPDRIESLGTKIHNLIDYYENGYISLKELIEKMKRTKEDSKIYETSEKVFLWLFIPVIILGVIIPYIIVVNEKCLYDFFSSSWFQLTYLILSFIPYIGFSVWGLRELKSRMI